MILIGPSPWLALAGLGLAFAFGPGGGGGGGGDGGGSDPEKGLAMFQAGQFAEAAEVFQKALLEDPDNAELAYNLALAKWRAGDVEGAEIAAEKAATLSGGALSALRDGILGNLRFDASQAAAGQDTPDLPLALGLAQQAREHFLRGAVEPVAGPELRRNLERAARLIDELKKKIEEQEQEKKEQEKNEDGEKKDGEQDEQKKDQEKKDQEKKDEQQEQEQEKEKEQPKSEQNQESKEPDPSQADEGKPDEPQPKPEGDDQQKPDQQEQQEQEAPEQQTQGQEGAQELDKLLSEEQKKRLLDKLEELEQQRQRYRASMRAGRPRVKKDW